MFTIVLNTSLGFEDYAKTLKALKENTRMMDHPTGSYSVTYPYTA